MYSKLREFFINLYVSFSALKNFKIIKAEVLRQQHRCLNTFSNFRHVWAGPLISPILFIGENTGNKGAEYLYGSTNTTLNWLPGEEEIFKIKGNKHYKNKNITYTINSLGFRVYNRWGGRKQIHCFGCSGTFGYGLPDNETWPWLLHDKLGIKDVTVKNYGVSGASNDYICRAIYTHLLTEKPDVIICFFPEIYRMEYFSEKYKDAIISLCPVIFKKFMVSEALYDAYFEMLDQYNSFFNFVKNFKFIELLCKQHNVKFIWHTWGPTLLNLDTNTLKHYLGNDLSCIIKNNKIYDIQKENDLHDVEHKARDGEHQGLKFNQILSDEFIKLINS